MSTTKQRKPKIHAKIRKEKDLETHIRTQWALGHEFVEMRDYVPSTDTYGRGIAIERHLLPDLIDSLQELEDRLGGKRTSQAEIPGQQTLFDSP